MEYDFSGWATKANLKCSDGRIITKDAFKHNDGMKVSNLYIAQVKAKYGIIERENYNLPKSEDSRQPQCPVEKEKAIKDALEHFGMV